MARGVWNCGCVRVLEELSAVWPTWMRTPGTSDTSPAEADAGSLTSIGAEAAAEEADPAAAAAAGAGAGAASSLSLSSSSSSSIVAGVTAAGASRFSASSRLDNRLPGAPGRSLTAGP